MINFKFMQCEQRRYCCAPTSNFAPISTWGNGMIVKSISKLISQLGAISKCILQRPSLQIELFLDFYIENSKNFVSRLINNWTLYHFTAASQIENSELSLNEYALEEFSLYTYLLFKNNFNYNIFNFLPYFKKRTNFARDLITNAK